MKRRNLKTWPLLLFTLFMTLCFIKSSVLVRAQEPSQETGSPSEETTQEEPVDIGSADVTILDAESLIYTGKAITPAITVTYNETPLTAGQNYTVTYQNNVNAGAASLTLSGIGEYCGTKTVAFTIQRKNINDSDVKIANIPNKTYAGRAYSPSVNIQYNGMKLIRKAGNDYLARYQNNINAGTATGTVSGIGNYTGKKTVTFQIMPKNITDASFSCASVKTYTGSKIKPAVTIKISLTDANGKKKKVTLVKNTDYSLTYVDNVNVGTAGILIDGKGNYTSSRIMTFTIRPKAVKLTSLKKGKKRFTAKWTAQKVQATGYILQYSTKKTFAASATKKVVIKKAKGAKLLKKGLKSKKKYYVRVRTYKNVAGLKYYSAWSNVKSVKTK